MDMTKLKSEIKMSNLEENLKPCPLCEGDVMMVKWVYQNSQTMQHGQIRCKKCGLIMPTWSDVRWADTYEIGQEMVAINTWNTRIEHRSLFDIFNIFK